MNIKDLVPEYELMCTMSSVLKDMITKCNAKENYEYCISRTYGRNHSYTNMSNNNLVLKVTNDEITSRAPSRLGCYCTLLHSTVYVNGNEYSSDIFNDLHDLFSLSTVFSDLEMQKLFVSCSVKDIIESIDSEEVVFYFF